MSFVFSDSDAGYNESDNQRTNTNGTKRPRLDKNETAWYTCDKVHDVLLFVGNSLVIPGIGFDNSCSMMDIILCFLNLPMISLMKD